jgi:hypothetical protein
MVCILTQWLTFWTLPVVTFYLRATFGDGDLPPSSGKEPTQLGPIVTVSPHLRTCTLSDLNSHCIHLKNGLYCIRLYLSHFLAVPPASRYLIYWPVRYFTWHQITSRVNKKIASTISILNNPTQVSCICLMSNKHGETSCSLVRTLCVFSGSLTQRQTLWWETPCRITPEWKPHLQLLQARLVGFCRSCCRLLLVLVCVCLLSTQD